MPLIKRSSKAARAVNVRRLIDEGYPPRQAVAIAYSTQRAAKAKNRAGGKKAYFPLVQHISSASRRGHGALTRVILADGRHVDFVGYLSKREAIRQLEIPRLNPLEYERDIHNQNQARGRRNRAGVDVDTLARIARHARSVMREQFDGWVSFGKLRDPIGHAQVIRWLMERQADRTDAGYKRNAERFGEREAAFRKGMADEAHDLISEITIKLDPVYVASLKKSNKAGGKRRGARR